MKPKLYVVEGTHDETLLRQLDSQIKTISVGGSQIKEDVLDFLVTYEDKFDIILMFDPDYAGERIRKIVAKNLKKPKHIFIQKEIAYNKTGSKIGIEHLSLEHLKQALQQEVHQSNDSAHITINMLYALGLTGQKDSKQKRKSITKKLHLTYSNTKTFMERLNWIGITYERLKELVDASS